MSHQERVMGDFGWGDWRGGLFFVVVVVGGEGEQRGVLSMSCQ